MPSLASVALRFSSTFITEDGVPFVGTLQPAGEGEVPNFLFALPRRFLRVPADSPLTAGKIFADDFGGFFLTADYESVELQNNRLFKMFQVFSTPNNVTWKRNATSTDPLTGLAKGTGSKTTLGDIRCSIDMIGREYPDRVSNAREETLRLVTGSAVQLNDYVDNKIVKKVNRVMGIYVAEIQ